MTVAAAQGSLRRCASATSIAGRMSEKNAAAA
jgi:hypothetical protein